MRHRLGIDVGGTNTDAVILDEQLRVVASVKSPTTEDTGDGIVAAVDAVLARSGVDPGSISHAMLGTTHCTNAIVERRGLSKVGVLRLGAPATTAVPPLEGWPDDLRDAIGEHTYLIAGGLEHDGRGYSQIDDDEIRAACHRMRGHVDAVAVIGVFSPIDERQEIRAAEVASEVLSVPITRSACIGSIGLLERENATVLNAALKDTLTTLAQGFIAALHARDIDAEVCIGQNDGTLMRLDYALEFPVLTIGCGPTNSIRGAAHLSAVADALVVDIGGTTTDIGVLVNGFPRQSAEASDIGGIRTNFRMPDVLSFGLGGGTLVDIDGASVRIGPESVGHRIHSEALAFGGTKTTVTDIALASGNASIPGVAEPSIDPTVRDAALDRVRAMIEEAIDRMKPSADAVPVVLVGGGSIVAPDNLDGVSEVIRPEHFGAANAVGAALADVAGQVEKLYRVENGPADALADAAQEAHDRAIMAGAAAKTVEVVELEELPLAYMEENTVMIRARAVGQLAE